jgi:hypothetical protein
VTAIATQRTRRSLLAAAAAGAAGIAASRLAVPPLASAADGNPLLIGTANTATSTTSLTCSTAAQTGLQIGTTGDATAFAASGQMGVFAHGSAVSTPGSIVGMYARVDFAGNGPAIVANHAASVDVLPVNTAIFAAVSSTAHHGIHAMGGVKFPDRSNRATIKAGKSSVTVTVPGTTSANFAIATLGANRSGRWVRAVVCASGKITIYLNSSVASATLVTWLVLG